MPQPRESPGSKAHVCWEQLGPPPSPRCSQHIQSGFPPLVYTTRRAYISQLFQNTQYSARGCWIPREQAIAHTPVFETAKIHLQGERAQALPCPVVTHWGSSL